MKNRRVVYAMYFTALLCCSVFSSVFADDVQRLQEGFQKPPVESRLWAYWWILNGNVDKAAVERDLREMEAKGFGGLIYCDANGSNQDGNINVAPGPCFASSQWKEIFHAAVETASQKGLSMSLNIQSGWNLGGPTVKPENAAKILCWSETAVSGNGKVEVKLSKGKPRERFYRDIAVIAYPIKENAAARKNLDLLSIKTAQVEFGGSAPDCSPLSADEVITPGEQDAEIKDILDISDYFNSASETLTWTPPAGAKRWNVLRFGYTLSGGRVSTSSGKWQGAAIDHLSKQAFDIYWNENIVPILEDVKPFIGKTLRYVHTDSWELGGINWTDSFPEEFLARRNYNIIPYLPIVAGKIIGNRQISNQFLHDFRRTIGDLIRDNHYVHMKLRAGEWGMDIHPESGGPHGAPLDSLQLLGRSAIPMSEFWSWSPRHRIGEVNRFFVKQPASAAHVFGRRFVAAEGFTNIGMHWNESWANNLKPSFDQALCEGLNLLVWHAFTCSPASAGLPGQEYFAGTHFNPQSLLWNDSPHFLNYINRCQFMLQQGIPANDVLEFYGDNVPNFTQYKNRNTAGALPGYGFDTASEEAIIQRVLCKNGKLVLPDGGAYRVLVLPNRNSMSVPMIRKIQSLVLSGATVIGPKPTRTSGLVSPALQAEFKTISDSLWGDSTPENAPYKQEKNTETKNEFSVSSPAVPDGYVYPAPTSGKKQIRKAGLGRVISGASANDILHGDNILPDFEYTLDASASSPGRIEWIHRKIFSGQTINPQRTFSDFTPVDVNTIPAEGNVQADVYFVTNLSDANVNVSASFGVVNADVELWNPLDGSIIPATGVTFSELQTHVPISLSAWGSTFVVFHHNRNAKTAEINRQALQQPQEELIADITTPWQVLFPGIPAFNDKPIQTEFAKLESWTLNSDRNIRYYSGTAEYKNSFAISKEVYERISSDSQNRLALVFGDVKEIARVIINGKDLGVVWAKPYSVDITSAIKAGENTIEIHVSTNWNNRRVGDLNLPESERKTKTNITRIQKNSPLLESGLLGFTRIYLKHR